jgi:hypothetical protein
VKGGGNQEIERMCPFTSHVSPFTPYAHSFALETDMFCAIEIRTKWTTSRNP